MTEILTLCVFGLSTFAGAAVVVGHNLHRMLRRERQVNAWLEAILLQVHDAKDRLDAQIRRFDR